MNTYPVAVRELSNSVGETFKDMVMYSVLFKGMYVFQTEIFQIYYFSIFRTIFEKEIEKQKQTVRQNNHRIVTYSLQEYIQNIYRYFS